MCPVFVRIGGFAIYWYGVLAAAGVLVSSLIFQRLALRNGYDRKTVSEIVFWTVFWGIIGGRTVHVLAHYFYYYRNPREIILLRNGGLAIQGAIFGVIVFLTVYLEKQRLNFVKTLDLMALAVPVGQMFGRAGCFLNGCCYGRSTRVFWGVQFPFLQEKVHPTQLYYMAACLFVLVILWSLYRRKERVSGTRVKDGVIFYTYLLLFGFGRYGLDFLRGDIVVGRFGLALTQVFGIGFFLAGAAGLYRIAFGDKRQADHG